jgi:3',5'-nucleoside bisphosphate phosphatase
LLKRGRLLDLKSFLVDLHIHTVLSPCTEIAEMTPKAIVRTSKEKGLHAIAICDHNSARNAAATIRAAAGTGLTVLPGMEITSAEEVHILGLFRDVESVTSVQEEVYARLIGQNDEDAFGYQVVVDENDLVDDMDDRLLIGATTLNVEKVANLIHKYGGLAVASHVDRSGFGIFGQLGFIPDTLKLDALEISKRADYEKVREKYPQCRRFPLITSSDAHYLKDIASAATKMLIAEPSFDEIRKAILGAESRKIIESE